MRGRGSFGRFMPVIPVAMRPADLLCAGGPHDSHDQVTELPSVGTCAHDRRASQQHGDSDDGYEKR
jgi:hypothetical protein